MYHVLNDNEKFKQIVFNKINEPILQTLNTKMYIDKLCNEKYNLLDIYYDKPFYKIVSCIKCVFDRNKYLKMKLNIELVYKPSNRLFKGGIEFQKIITELENNNYITTD